MHGPPTPANEIERLAALRAYEVLDTIPEEAFDRITRIASKQMGAPIALVSLVDELRQWFKSRVGLDASETPREHAFCAHAVNGHSIFEIEDAKTDPRFASNPLVLGPPHIRFYAGAPLMTTAGAIGTLCVIDRRPRGLSAEDRTILSDLAAMVVDALETRIEAARSRRNLERAVLAEELAGLGHFRHVGGDAVGYWSPQMYRILGLDPGIAASTLDAVVAAHHSQDRRLIVEAIEGQRPFDLELRVVRPDGEVRQVRSVGRWEDVPGRGEASATFGVVQDVTDQAALRARLHQAEKMASIGTLAAGVAHEVNNPLSYIKANSDVLYEEIEALSGASPSARLRELVELVEEIRDGTRRIHRIVQGLKAFSRTSDGRVHRVELPRVLEVATRLCANELRHRATVTGDKPSNTPQVLADESQLVQVVVNLIVNAAHALPDSNVSANCIEISCGATEDGHAFITVEDNGSGMSEEVQRKALSPFFTTKPEGIGTGLGLAICHGIVTSFEGTVEIQSEVGVGTEIRIVLPPCPEQGLEAEDRPSRSPATTDDGPSRILVIDDEPRVGRSIGRLLRRHQVRVERDAREALDMLEQGETFDAILCDLMMPAMTGQAFFEALRASRPELAPRVLFVTGGAFTPEGQEFVSQNASRILEKPVEPEHLRDALRRVLNETREPLS